MTRTIAKKKIGVSSTNHGWAAKLQECHGPIVGGRELAKLLAFQSLVAFRQAASRGKLPVTVFSIPHRRGKFAYTCDVADWLEQLGNSSEETHMR